MVLYQKMMLYPTIPYSTLTPHHVSMFEACSVEEQTIRRHDGDLELEGDIQSCFDDEWREDAPAYSNSCSHHQSDLTDGMMDRIDQIRWNGGRIR